MPIQFTTVTWYSKTLTLFVFVAAIVFCIYAYFEYQTINNLNINSLIAKDGQTQKEKILKTPSKKVDTPAIRVTSPTDLLWVPISLGQGFYSKKDGQIYNYYSVLQTADPETFLVSSIDHSYAKDKNNIYFDSDLIPQADLPTFRVLGRSDHVGLCEFAKDKNYLYLARKATSILADLSSFEFILDSNGQFTGYAKDKERVYYNNCAYQNATFVPLSDADPSTFVVIAGFGGTMNNLDPVDSTPAYPLVPFGKDSKHVYVATTSMSGVDAPSFTSLNNSDNYYYDNKKVYFYNRGSGLVVLPEVVLSTFSANTDTFFSSDGVHLYWRSDLIKGADPETFAIIIDGDGKQTQYEKDKSNIYFLNEQVIGVDYQTFTIPNPYPTPKPFPASPDGFYNGQDKNHKYLNGELIN